MTFPEVVAATDTEADRPVLTASLAIRLAEEALNCGRVDDAVCYVNMAYAICDSHAERCARPSSAWRPSGDRT